MPETAKDLPAAILLSTWTPLAVSAFGLPPTFPLLLAAWSPARVLSPDNFPSNSATAPKIRKTSSHLKLLYRRSPEAIQTLLPYLKPYSPIMKFGYRVNEVSKRPSEPVKPPDDKRISLSKVAESLRKAFPFRFRTRPTSARRT
jgi:hypothetical protein